MGSWNDFYLQVLGEAEETRTSLSAGISWVCDELEALILAEPREPRTGLLSLIFDLMR